MSSVTRIDYQVDRILACFMGGFGRRFRPTAHADVLDATGVEVSHIDTL